MIITFAVFLYRVFHTIFIYFIKTTILLNDNRNNLDSMLPHYIRSDDNSKANLGQPGYR